jgi:hypothetical protein
MKHLLNDLSEKEKNSIREQHTDKLKVDTSKFKKLMESKLGEVKPMVEQNSIGGKVNNISKDLESGDILIVKDKDNKVSNLQVVSSQPPAGLTAKNPMGKMSKFIIGPQDNQLRAPETMPGDFVFTVSKVKVGDKTVDVDESGNFSF